jgi:hypothetical protein
MQLKVWLLNLTTTLSGHSIRLQQEGRKTFADRNVRNGFRWSFWNVSKTNAPPTGRQGEGLFATGWLSTRISIKFYSSIPLYKYDCKEKCYLNSSYSRSIPILSGQIRHSSLYPLLHFICRWRLLQGVAVDQGENMNNDTKANHFTYDCEIYNSLGGGGECRVHNTWHERSNE